MNFVVVSQSRCKNSVVTIACYGGHQSLNLLFLSKQSMKWLCIELRKTTSRLHLIYRQPESYISYCLYWNFFFLLSLYYLCAAAQCLAIMPFLKSFHYITSKMLYHFIFIISPNLFTKISFMNTYQVKKKSLLTSS